MYKNKFSNSNQAFKVNTLNTPYLIIVESPSKCGKIEKYLGFQYKCISSKGHIRQLNKVKSKKDNYEPVFEIIKEKQTHVEMMEKIISQFEPQNIYLAADDDREGEAIAWHICQVFRLNIDTTKRIIFHEITQEALMNAVQNPLHLRMNIVVAQQTRQILDRIIGFKISPFLSKVIVHEGNDFLSAGRCQTPALRLVYDNDIKSHEKQLQLEYEVFGTFFSHPSTTKFKLHKNLPTKEVCLNFLEKSKTHAHKLQIKKATSKTSAPPKPFNTSQLLQTANGTIHSSPKQTMALAQQLYQEGLITYMRTDSIKYAGPFLEKAKTYIEQEFDDSYVGNLDFLENKAKNDPHEAIRVTDLNTKTIQGDKKLQALYNLIWSRTIESCMSPYEYSSTIVHISAPLENKYVHEIEIGIFLGWKRIKNSNELQWKQEQNVKYGLCNYAQSMINKEVSFSKIECIINNVNTPKHYTEAGLIQKMEELGIGRPSTFSMLVETIKDRAYVLKKNIEGETHTCTEFMMDKVHIIREKEIEKSFGGETSKLVIENLGKQVVQLLVQHFSSIFSYEYTKHMETALDELMHNTQNNIQLISDCEAHINECMKPLQTKIKESYDIDGNAHVVFGKNGAYIKYKDSDKTETINPNIQLDFLKLENKQYNLDELIEISDKRIGVYENEPMYLKRGKYGAYVQWGENTKSLRTICPKNKSLQNISFEQICSILDANKNSHILRTINAFANIQSGKYGPFVYYKTPAMKKPLFVSLKKFPKHFMNCELQVILEWLQEKHNIALV